MVYRKTHPYERENPEHPKEDVVKRFKNLNRATTLFCLFLAVTVMGFYPLFGYTFIKTDINIYLSVLLVIFIGVLLYKPTFTLLSKIFPDPSKGIIFTCFIIVGPVVFTTLMGINILFSFNPSEDKLEIVGVETERRSTKKSTYNVYILQLENDEFYYQPDFRTYSHRPYGKYINYQFRRGILGFRVLDGIYFSD